MRAHLGAAGANHLAARRACLTQATLAGCKDVMNAPLPHTYEETASASGGGVKSLESIGGPGFSPEQMSRVRRRRWRIPALMCC